MPFHKANCMNKGETTTEEAKSGGLTSSTDIINFDFASYSTENTTGKDSPGTEEVHLDGTTSDVNGDPLDSIAKKPVSLGDK